MTTTVSFTVATADGPRPVSVAYERTGSGEPLLLLHGIGHHLRAWDPVARILAAEREVIAVDLPGFGTSPALPDGVPYDLGTVGPVYEAFCAELGLDRPHVAGNSLGGMHALELGRAGLARSVTALSPAGFWTEAERRYAFGTLRTMRRSALALPVPLIERLSRSASRPDSSHQHHLRPARQAFTGGRRRRDARPAWGDRISPDAGGRPGRLLRRGRQGHTRHGRLGHPRPDPAAAGRASAPSG